MKNLLLSLITISTCLVVWSQSEDSLPNTNSFPEWALPSDSGHVTCFEPPVVPFTANELLLGTADSLIRLGHTRRRYMIVVTDDSSGVITRVYMARLRYSHDSLIERKHGYCCEFDERGRLVSVVEYRRGKQKYQWDLNWDAEKKRYY